MDLLFPPLCETCNQKMAAHEDLICDDCLRKIPFRGRRTTHFTVAGEVYLDGALVLADFQPEIQHLIHLLKYSRRTRVVSRLAAFWEIQIRELLAPGNYDIIAPIPLHPRKQRERGYNQVSKLVLWLGRQLQVKTQLQLLKRTRYTPTQTHLNARERFHNVQGAFSVTEPVDQLKILLVDDVLTTGSTANSCAAALKPAGAVQVELLALATPVKVEA